VIFFTPIEFLFAPNMFDNAHLRFWIVCTLSVGHTAQFFESFFIRPENVAKRSPFLGGLRGRGWEGWIGVNGRARGICNGQF